MDYFFSTEYTGHVTDGFTVCFYGVCGKTFVTVYCVEIFVGRSSVMLFFVEKVPGNRHTVDEDDDEKV